LENSDNALERPMMIGSRQEMNATPFTVIFSLMRSLWCKITQFHVTRREREVDAQVASPTARKPMKTSTKTPS